ncbi:hypothetical protein D9M71_554220 [compost metagenome]
MVGPACFLVQKRLGGEHQFVRLAPVDTAERAAKVRMQPIANFDEYYCIAVEHDQIKLASFASPVLRQQAQALPLKVLKGVPLGGLACVLA